MTSVFYLPASQGRAARHYEISLRDGVELERFRSLRRLYPKLEKRATDGRIYAWGTRPTPRGRSRWERLLPGDVALIYQQGMITSSAQVYAKIRSATVARSIWGSQAGETWEYMYFVDRPVRIDAPIERLRDALDYSPIWIPQGFDFLGQEREEVLLSQFGSVADFIAAIATRRVDTTKIAEPPEIQAERAQGRSSRRRRGQGWQADPLVRKAIENHAMRTAKRRFRSEGWSVEDTSGNRPYDLVCRRRGRKDLRVEVKGTTGTGATVELTEGEVLNAEVYSPVALFVVSDVSVDRSDPKKPRAHGGIVDLHLPWKIRDVDLRATRFMYSVPA